MAFTIHIAKLETRNFTFEGAGTDRAHAVAVLRAALAKHAHEYGLAASGWFHEDDIAVMEYRTGKGYRDGSPINPKGARNA